MGWLIDLINFLGCGQNFPPPHPPLPTSGWTSSWQQERGGSNRENINKKKGTVKQAQCCEVIQLIGFPRIWFLKDGKKIIRTGTIVYAIRKRYWNRLKLHAQMQQDLKFSWCLVLYVHCTSIMKFSSEQCCESGSGINQSGFTTLLLKDTGLPTCRKEKEDLSEANDWLEKEVLVDGASDAGVVYNMEE